MDTGYDIDCTGDVVVGDEIMFAEAVWGGYSPYRRRAARPLGQRMIEARVVSDSYGADKQQHTFTLEVLASSGDEPVAAGATIRRKGRNVYRNGVRRRAWADESGRREAQDEKHARGQAARMARDFRRETGVGFGL